MTTVLDASALIALVKGEPGAHRVAECLDEALISAVNWSEVVASLMRRPEIPGQLALATETLAGRVVAFDAGQAETSGRLLPLTRHLGLSLGDRCCLALARSVGVPVMTADRAWAVLDVGVAIEVIR